MGVVVCVGYVVVTGCVLMVLSLVDVRWIPFYLTLHIRRPHNTLVVQDLSYFDSYITPMMTIREQQQNVMIEKEEEKSDYYLKHDEDFAEIRRFLLLTSQASGSHWLSQRLLEHKRIHMVFPCEAFSDFETRSRLSHVLGYESREVTWEELEARLVDTFNRMEPSNCIPFEGKEAVEDRCPRCRVRGREDVVGAKIHRSQIPLPLRHRFADWCVENNITIINLHRSSTLESLFSQLAKDDVRQQLHNQRARTTSASAAEKVESTTSAFFIPHSVYTFWQESEAQLLQIFSDLLHFHPAGLPVLDVSYEALVGPFGNRHYHSILTFLQLPLTQNLHDYDIDEYKPEESESHEGLEEEGREYRRLHPHWCGDKVSNFEELKSVMTPTSIYACYAPSFHHFDSSSSLSDDDKDDGSD